MKRFCFCTSDCFNWQVTETQIREDDTIIDDVLQKNEQLHKVAHDVTNFFATEEYNTTRETLLGDICKFLSDTIQEAIVVMGTKACHVRVLSFLGICHLLRTIMAILAVIIIMATWGNIFVAGFFKKPLRPILPILSILPRSAGEISTLDLKAHEEGDTKSKTGAISGSTKWTLDQRKNLKKKNLFVCE